MKSRKILEGQLKSERDYQAITAQDRGLWKSRAEKLMGLIEAHKNSNHIDCNCEDCTMVERAEEIMEGEV